MPNTREKLIGLLGANTCKHDYCEDCEYCENRDACIAYLKDSMADYLIANGVTAQKWIPVTERLPEKSDYYLVHTGGGNINVIPYSAHHKVFNAFDSNLQPHFQIAVTHWMPLPPAPKGE